MEVTYQLTPEDLYQGCLAWRDQRKWRKWLRWIAYFVVGTGTLLCIWTFFLDRVPDTSFDLGGIAFGVAWLTWMLLAPRFFSKRQFRNNPMAQSPITVDISEAGFRFHNAHADSNVAWSAYVGWEESKSVFVIMPQPRIYVTIPKRAFTEEQVREFREILRRNIVRK
jgi:hypothetical protein